MSDTLHDVLVEIQQELKVPKDINNDFGGFKYRNLEQIEDKLKPFLKKFNLTLKFDDEMVAVGDRVYVKATATLSNGTDSISGTAYAREAVTPKAKMDDSQLTGSCSSYARKYAAAGLFLIDDTKDADSFGAETHKSFEVAQAISQQGTRDFPERKPVLNSLASPKQKQLINDKLNQKGIADEDKKNYLLDNYGITGELSKEDASMVIDDLIEGASYARK